MFLEKLIVCAIGVLGPGPWGGEACYPLSALTGGLGTGGLSTVVFLEQRCPPNEAVQQVF